MTPSASASVLPLGALPQGAPFGEALAFQIAGLAVVMLSLSALWVLCEIVSRLFKRAAELPPKSGPKPQAGAASAAPDAEGPGGEITAVIAAAVIATFGRGAVIREIRPPAPAPINPQLAAWTLQGRLQHHTSHSLR